MSIKKKALFITANYWETPYRVGSHEIANLFIENGWSVAFISDPVSPLHLFKIKDQVIKERFRSFLAGGKKYFNDNLWAYVPFTFLPPQNFPILKTKFAFNNWHRFTIPNILKKIKFHGFDDVDLIYFDNATQAVWIDIIKYKKSVFRIVDNYTGYPKFTEQTRVMEKVLAKKVDLILYTAKNLKKYLPEIENKNSCYFPNGVNFKFFSGKSPLDPADIKNIPRPRIIYIGEMEVRFDFELIKYASQKLPNYSFILIGNDIKAKQILKNLPNVYILGIKKFDEIPNYLHNSDVGIIPFDVNKMGDLINFVNPIKIHQYFACGLPVVSAKWEELENLKTKALLYDTKESFIKLLIKATNDPINENGLIEEAKKNDWQLRYERLTKLLGFDK